MGRTALRRGRKLDQVARLLENAEDSLNAGIKYFYEHQGEAPGYEHCLLMLEHAFEMLFKAYVLKETGNVLENRNYTRAYDFRECVLIAFDFGTGETGSRASLYPAHYPVVRKKLQPRQYTAPATAPPFKSGKLKKTRGVRTAYNLSMKRIPDIKGASKEDVLDVVLLVTELRNMAQHYLCVLSNELLTCFFYSAVSVFSAVRDVAFKNLKYKPIAMHPVEAVPSLNMTEVVTKDMERIANSTSEELRGVMLDVYVTLDRYIGYKRASGTDAASYNIENLVKRVNKRVDWRVSFPFLHNLRFDSSRSVAPLYVDASVSKFNFASLFPHDMTKTLVKLGLKANSVNISRITKVCQWLQAQDELDYMIDISTEKVTQKNSRPSLSSTGLDKIRSRIEASDLLSLAKQAEAAGFKKPLPGLPHKEKTE